MKQALLTVLQLVLLLVAYAAATFAIPCHRETVSVHTGTVTRVFLWDGVITDVLLFLLFLTIAATRKRLRSALPLSLVALVLSFTVSYALKLGFVTHEF